MREERRTRIAFWVVWVALFMIKLVLAARLPLFVDEAFYWQESRHLAWAYSDLPGLTAWLIHLGTTLAGEHLLGVRWPFLMLGAALPLLVVLIARPLGETRAWQAGVLALLFPLSGLLGVLALPDVPMNLAAAACLLGGMRALHGVDWQAALWLALGLAIGALSHYRFIGVIGVGFVALLWLPAGRQVLRDPRIWIALALGALAWLPLALWNVNHGDVGWRFQLVDRHPWTLQAEGLRFVVIQALLATPLVFIAMLVGATRLSAGYSLATRWLALCGGLTLAGFFMLGFVADAERVSFHWTLPGYLALLALVPGVFAGWSRVVRRASVALLALGLLLAIGVIVSIASDKGRAALARSAFYPENFAGWSELADVVHERLGSMPEGTRLIVDHFKLGAELGFALGNPDISVLDHPLNHHHGRAGQLALWGLLDENPSGAGWRLVVVAASDLKLRARLERYQFLCRHFGALPAPQIVEIDRGARQFLLFALPPGQQEGSCSAAAIMHVDTPRPGTQVGRAFSVWGWAIKDEVGIARVVLLLDGEPLVDASYGDKNSWAAEFFADLSRDPNLPNVQFEADVVLPASVSGWHVLGLELHGADGSIERWAGPRVQVVDTPE